MGEVYEDLYLVYEKLRIWSGCASCDKPAAGYHVAATISHKAKCRRKEQALLSARTLRNLPGVPSNGIRLLALGENLEYRPSHSTRRQDDRCGGRPYENPHQPLSWIGIQHPSISRCLFELASWRLEHIGKYKDPYTLPYGQTEVTSVNQGSA